MKSNNLMLCINCIIDNCSHFYYKLVNTINYHANALPLCNNLPSFIAVLITC